MKPLRASKALSPGKTGHWECPALLAGVLALLAAGCNPFPAGSYVPTPEGVSLINNTLAKLPSENARAKSVLPGALGPSGSLFGLLLEDDSELFVIGTDDGSGNITITSVVLYDPSGSFVLQQDMYDGGTSLVFASGDAVDYDFSGTTPRIGLVLNATSPASIIVLDVLPDGSVVENDTYTRIEATLNSSYSAETARLRVPDGLPLLKSAPVQLSNYRCTQVGNVVAKVAQLFCDVVNAWKKKLTVELAEKVCIGANTAIDLVQAFRAPVADDIESRIFAGLKLGLTVICEGTKAVADIATYVYNATTPTGIFCLGISLLDSGTTVYTGQSLAQQLCTMFLTDQNLGGFAVKSSTIQLSVVDTKAEDGDMIAITHNGQQVFSGVVSNTARTLTLTLDPGFNQLEFEALNEGSEPPNTAQVTVVGAAGSNLASTSYNLSFGQVATLTVILRS